MDSFFNTELIDQMLNLVDKINNEIIVIVIDDSIVDDEIHLSHILDQIITLSKFAAKVIVVHGGIKDVQAVFNKYNVSSIYNPYDRGIREEHIELVKLGLRGHTSLRILNSINIKKGMAVNFCGYDANFLRARSIKRTSHVANTKNIEEIIDFGCFGEVSYIDPALLLSYEYVGMVNLVTPIAGNDQGKTFFVDAVNLGLAISSSIFANRFIVIRDSLAEFHKNDIFEIKVDKINRYIAQNIFPNKLSIQLKSISKHKDLFTETINFIDGKEKDCIFNSIFSMEDNSISICY